jgi:CRP-like cAMP-binding protein
MKKFKLGKSKSKSKSSPSDNDDSFGIGKKPSSSSSRRGSSSPSNTSSTTSISTTQGVDDLLEKWERRGSDVNNADSDDEDANNNEPKQEIFMGTRRLTLTNIEKIKDQMREIHMKDGKYIPSISEEGGGGKMPPPPSSSSGKAPPPPGEYQRPSTSSVSNNVLCNIHSSPLTEFDITYQPPVYPKSESEQEFISLSLQRNFVFANALSDDEIVRKREMKQVVDAFEYHAVKYSGTMILNHMETGDYFYILKEGSVRYYQKYRPSGVKDELGTGKCIGMANKPGQSFGELCLLYDCPPPADCVSSGDPSETECMCEDGVSACSFWRIHKSTFRQILALRSMRRDVRLREALQKVDVLQELDIEYLKKIADALHARNAEKGEILYKEGGICDRFYLIGTEGKVQLSSSMRKGVTVLGPGQACGTSAISHGLRPDLLADGGGKGGGGGKGVFDEDGPPRYMETAMALERTVILSMSSSHFKRVVGSLEDAILLSRDRRLLRSVPLFRDTDLEDFEYELLTALIENVTLRFEKEIFVEGDNVDEPALYIVRSGEVEVISEDKPSLNRIIGPGGFFGEETLTPDENMRFGGAKGGNKYSDETVDVISEEGAVLGKLTLANIDSVVQDLHRLGCRRKKDFKRKGRKGEDEPVESLDDLDFHRLFGAGTFGRVWIVSPFGKRVAYALKIQSKRELLDQRQAGGAQRERSVMVKLDHPFVCKLVNTFQDEACIYMLLQFVQGGELLNLIQGGDAYGGLPESAAKFFAAGILEGLTHMHQRQIVYRDLKPENVLLDKDGYAVIVDFGFCEYILLMCVTVCENIAHVCCISNKLFHFAWSYVVYSQNC